MNPSLVIKSVGLYRRYSCPLCPASLCFFFPSFSVLMTFKSQSILLVSFVPNLSRVYFSLKGLKCWFYSTKLFSLSSPLSHVCLPHFSCFSYSSPPRSFKVLFFVLLYSFVLIFLSCFCSFFCSSTVVFRAFSSHTVLFVVPS